MESSVTCEKFIFPWNIFGIKPWPSILENRELIGSRARLGFFSASYLHPPALCGWEDNSCTWSHRTRRHSYSLWSSASLFIFLLPLARANKQILAPSPIHSHHQGGEARIGDAGNGLLATEFLRDLRDGLVGNSGLKRTGPAGLVGPQRCRLKKHVWESLLAELKWALDYKTVLEGISIFLLSVWQFGWW